ncbi:MAG: terpene cyclase/mutase family protein [Anaerolineae bacterium]|nr:terpene cyclase/mutase family protein [Anaerolineae bacterium]
MRDQVMLTSTNYVYSTSYVKTTTMQNDIAQAIEKAQVFLLHAQTQDGGWSYTPGVQSSPESTCYSLLALSAAPFPSGAADNAKQDKGVAWLKNHVNAGGAITLEGDNDPHWTTSLAAFTLNYLQQEAALRERCIEWLLTWEGNKTKFNEIIPLNNELVGWPWTSDAFSWIEPTSYALLALKASGYANHARVQEGEALLLDRACTEGGWNYGNRIVLGRALDAFLPTTAVALLSLQNFDTASETIVQGLAFLETEIARTQSTLTLAWAILCLGTYHRPFDALVPPLLLRQRTDGSWREANHLTALSILALNVAAGGVNVFKV